MFSEVLQEDPAAADMLSRRLRDTGRLVELMVPPWGGGTQSLLEASAVLATICCDCTGAA